VARDPWPGRAASARDYNGGGALLTGWKVKGEEWGREVSSHSIIGSRTPATVLWRYNTGGVRDVL